MKQTIQQVRYVVRSEATGNIYYQGAIYKATPYNLSRCSFEESSRAQKLLESMKTEHNCFNGELGNWEVKRVEVELA